MASLPEPPLSPRLPPPPPLLLLPSPGPLACTRVGPTGSSEALTDFRRLQVVSKSFQASCSASHSSASVWGLSRCLPAMERTTGRIASSGSCSNAYCTASAAARSFVGRAPDAAA